MRRRRPRFASGVEAFAVATLHGKIVEECSSYQNARRHAQKRANDNGRPYYVARIHPYSKILPTKAAALRLIDPTAPADDDR